MVFRKFKLLRQHVFMGLAAYMLPQIHEAKFALKNRGASDSKMFELLELTERKFDEVYEKDFA